MELHFGSASWCATSPRRPHTGLSRYALDRLLLNPAVAFGADVGAAFRDRARTRSAAGADERPDRAGCGRSCSAQAPSAARRQLVAALLMAAGRVGAVEIEAVNVRTYERLLRGEAFQPERLVGAVCQMRLARLDDRRLAPRPVRWSWADLQATADEIYPAGDAMRFRPVRSPGRGRSARCSAASWRSGDRPAVRRVRGRGAAPRPAAALRRPRRCSGVVAGLRDHWRVRARQVAVRAGASDHAAEQDVGFARPRARRTNACRPRRHHAAEFAQVEGAARRSSVATALTLEVRASRTLPDPAGRPVNCSAVRASMPISISMSAERQTPGAGSTVNRRCRCSPTSPCRGQAQHLVSHPSGPARGQPTLLERRQHQHRFGSR